MLAKTVCFDKTLNACVMTQKNGKRSCPLTIGRGQRRHILAILQYGDQKRDLDGAPQTRGGGLVFALRLTVLNKTHSVDKSTTP